MNARNSSGLEHNVIPLLRAARRALKLFLATVCGDHVINGIPGHTDNVNSTRPRLSRSNNTQRRCQVHQYRTTLPPSAYQLLQHVKLIILAAPDSKNRVRGIDVYIKYISMQPRTLQKITITRVAVNSTADVQVDNTPSLYILNAAGLSKPGAIQHLSVELRADQLSLPLSQSS